MADQYLIVPIIKDKRPPKDKPKETASDCPTINPTTIEITPAIIKTIKTLRL